MPLDDQFEAQRQIASEITRLTAEVAALNKTLQNCWLFRANKPVVEQPRVELPPHLLKQYNKAFAVWFVNGLFVPAFWIVVTILVSLIGAAYLTPEDNTIALLFLVGVLVFGIFYAMRKAARAYFTLASWRRAQN